VSSSKKTNNTNATNNMSNIQPGTVLENKPMWD